ncbi:MAG: DMT family transporter [Burkholderiales bacterium]|nr:DMT family transporter [Burkholderiales bacterium]
MNIPEIATRRRIGIAAAAVTVTIWTAFIVIARAMAHKTLTPFDIAFVRMIGAATVMLPWGWWWVRRARARNDPAGGKMWLGLSPYPWRTTAIAGTLAALLYASLAYSGFLFAPAAHASVLMPGMLPLWTTLIAIFVIGTPVTRRRWVGLALIIGGGMLVGGSSLLRAFIDTGGGEVWKGDVLFLASSFCWSCYTVYARKHQLAAIPATIAVCVFAAFSFVPVYALLVWTGVIVSHLREAPWSEIVFQALVQGIGSVVISGITFVRMVETFGPIRSTMITAVVPGLSALAAVLFLGEPLYWNLLLGLALVTVGIVFGVKPVMPAGTVPPSIR